MIERIDNTPYSADRFLLDLRSTASSIDAPFDETIVRKTLSVFDDEFRRCVVQLKATNRESEGVYYRFFYKWERDLTAVALANDLIAINHGPIVDLQADVLASFRGATRAGLDFDTSFGLAKVWTFTGGPTPLDEFLRLGSLPQSVREHRDFFLEHGMKHVFFVASDFQDQTMNVYFGLEDECRHEDWLRCLVDATGGAPTDPDQYQQMMASLAYSAGIGMTFSWRASSMGRWSLYGLNVPCDAPSVAARNLPRLPDRLLRFRELAPTLNARPQYNVAWSFGREGYYVKLEKSYAKDADYFLTVEMGGNLNHPDPCVESPSTSYSEP